MLSITHLSKSYDHTHLFTDVSFSVLRKDKIALIGENGVGKSTLLKIIAGEETLDEGERTLEQGVRISYLPQQFSFDNNATVQDVMNQEYVDKEEYEIRSVLTRLGILDTSKKIKELSGGQQKRVALAIALLKEFDLLLLDEPTNHLDLTMIEWLENYLKKLSKAFVMVTHDRSFMENITTKMMEVERGNIHAYEGNYETYLTRKEERDATRKVMDHKHKQLLKKELEWVRAGVQARGTKAKDRLQRFEKLKDVETYSERQQLQLYAVVPRIGKTTINFEDVSFGYNETPLFEHFTYACKRYDRLGIVGDNGVGKTTLLRLITNELQPTNGHVEIGETVRIGYFAQGVSYLEEDKRIIDFMNSFMHEVKRGDVQLSMVSVLEQFLFPKDKQYQLISQLSGGEKRRLYLLCVLLQGPNVLLLDEPTNDVDIETIQILEEYLDNFLGVVITVSHDRQFLDRVCDGILYMQDQTITMLPGIYSEQRFIKKEDKVEETKEVKKQVVSVSMSSKEKKELQEKEGVLEKLTKEIEDLDKQIQEKQEDYEEIILLSNLREEKSELLEEETERWMELVELKEKVDAIYK